MLSKRHYEAIAKMILRRFGVDTPKRKREDWPIRLFVGDLTDYFEQDDPRFDKDRFLKACGF